VHALDARAQLARLLRPAQQQLGQHGDLRRLELELGVDLVAVLLHALAGELHEVHEARDAQAQDGVGHLALGHGHQRVAVVLLVAARGESVEAQRVLLGRGELLLDEDAQHAGFEGLELDVGHGRMLARPIAPTAAHPASGGLHKSPPRRLETLRVPRHLAVSGPSTGALHWHRVCEEAYAPPRTPGARGDHP
jgi:hypothetical protein